MDDNETYAVSVEYSHTDGLCYRFGNFRGTLEDIEWKINERLEEDFATHVEVDSPLSLESYFVTPILCDSFQDNMMDAISGVEYYQTCLVDFVDHSFGRSAPNKIALMAIGFDENDENSWPYISITPIEVE